MRKSNAGTIHRITNFFYHNFHSATNCKQKPQTCWKAPVFIERGDLMRQRWKTTRVSKLHYELLLLQNQTSNGGPQLRNSKVNNFAKRKEHMYIRIVLFRNCIRYLKTSTEIVLLVVHHMDTCNVRISDT